MDAAVNVADNRATPFASKNETVSFAIGSRQDKAMKHPSSRAYFIYWDMMRGHAAAPERAALEPTPVRHLLDDIFVAADDGTGDFRFRMAGTRFRALLGDVEGKVVSETFDPDFRAEAEDIMSIAATETLATIAGLAATAPNGNQVALEWLLLPFAPAPGVPASLGGLIAPFTTAPGPLRHVTLSSWRHIAVDTTPRGPRTLRAWRAMTGMTVYEGVT